MKLSYKLKIFGVFLFALMISANIENGLGNLMTSDTSFSDELQHEQYNPITAVDDWYDGVETFWYDTPTEDPMAWKITEGAGTNVYVHASWLSHSNVMYMADASNAQATAEYFFEVRDNLGTYGFNMSYWYLVDYNSHESWTWISDDLSELCGFYSYAGTFQFIYNFDGLGDHYVLLYNSFSVDTWYYINLEVNFDDISNTVDIIVYLDGNLELDESYNDVRDIHQEIFSIELKTKGTWYSVPYGVLLDALNIKDFGSHETNDFFTQIQNLETTEYVDSNRYELDSTKLFSMFDSIIDRYPNVENNYRTYFLTDLINNIDMLERNRLLRLVGSSTSQVKYKVVQFYLNKLDNPNSFSDELNQSIRLRVDTFDISDNLINMLFLNLDFDNTSGLITWNAKYRESLAMPIWSNQLTNPIFDFSDYLPENENLTSIQINCHFFLTYNDTNKFLMIRTEVCFNDRFDYIYTYDKMIDLGYGAFYMSQSKLQVRYLDYSNPNIAMDYVGNDWYTYNNLEGIRTLELNSTDYKFNFLDCGFFSDDLDYYVPPDVPEDDMEDVPDEPSKPNLPYWTFDTYQLENHENTTIEYENDFIWLNTTETHTTTFNFGKVRGKKVQGYFPYHDDFIKSKHLPDLSFKLFGIKFKFLNQMLDFFRTIGNAGIVAAQFAMFVGWGIFINYIGMYLVMALIVPFLVNVLWFWILSGLLYAGHWIIIGVLSLIGVLFRLGVFLWEWLIEVMLPAIISVIITVLALVIALGLWLASGGTANFEALFWEVRGMLMVVADFLVESIIYFVENIAFFMLYILLYTVNVLLYMPKMAYCRSKGYYNRALQLESSFQVLILPFVWSYKLLVSIKEMVKWW